eukprot:TRINITY_DN16336_c0_g1_i1.p2 TRINITY_DN16336_c0_g1~~TRINITY_DN16336_c0_g1_i1.p2  ORF type:complete len:190 (+),score=47.96 TRINITY_DN16336_c0_g1_i1:80-649(+)
MEHCCCAEEAGPAPRSWPLAVCGGLLGSSCCVLQLGLNTLGFGCAGFAVLDPFRPYVAAATVSALAYKAKRNRDEGRFHAGEFALSALAAGALLISPLVVRRLNRSGGALSALAQRRYAVRGLKCEACAAGLRRAVNKGDGVSSCSVMWGGKERSDLLVNTDGRLDTVDRHVEKVVTEKGFELIPASAA